MAGAKKVRTQKKKKDKSALTINQNSHTNDQTETSYVETKESLEVDVEESEGSDQDSNQSMNDVSEFYKHYEIDRMITHKCISAMCIKLRNHRFCFKQISERISSEPFPDANKESPLDKVKQLQPWIDMLPQLPCQYVMQCYGSTKINGRYYSICDLVEDNEPLPFQMTQ